MKNAGFRYIDKWPSENSPMIVYNFEERPLCVQHENGKWCRNTVLQPDFTPVTVNGVKYTTRENVELVKAGLCPKHRKEELQKMAEKRDVGDLTDEQLNTEIERLQLEAARRRALRTLDDSIKEAVRRTYPWVPHAEAIEAAKKALAGCEQDETEKPEIGKLITNFYQDRQREAESGVRL